MPDPERAARPSLAPALHTLSPGTTMASLPILTSLWHLCLRLPFLWSESVKEVSLKEEEVK